MKKLKHLIFFIFCLMFFQGLDYNSNIMPSHSAFEHNNKGVINLERKYFYEAAQEFKLAISLNPNTPQTAIFYSNLAKVYKELNLYDAAIFCIEQSIKLDENKFNYFNDLVNVYTEKQKLLDAKVIYEQKSQINKEDYNSTLILALIYEKTGNKLKAINTYYSYIELKPNSPLKVSIEKKIKLIADNI